MRFEKIWVQQCRATKTIKRRLGAKSALDYLIREKLAMFAEEAERSPEFAKELPRFLAAIWQVFNQYELAGYREPEISRTKAITPAAVCVSLERYIQLFLDALIFRFRFMTSLPI